MEPLTQDQLKAKAYYQQNKARFIENAQRWRREHPEEARKYQAEYYQRNKNSHKYVLRQQQKNAIRQQQAEQRAKQRAEERAKRLEEERNALPLPIVIERPPTPPPEPPLPASAFVVKFL